MKNMFKVASLNFSTTKSSIIITIGVIIIQVVSNMIISSATGEAASDMSIGNFFYLYIIIIPFFIVLSNYKKLINLNASKINFYLGSILTYAISSVAISLLNTLSLNFLEKNSTVYMKESNLMELTGWMENGILIAFIQQAIFIFLFAIFLHVLISLQTHWVGWMIDFIIVIILSVFLPIEVLRNAVSNFFELIMFNSNYILHISSCLILSITIFLLGMIPLKKRIL